MTSIPSVDSVGDIYQLHWSPENILIKIDHLTEDDAITGEFTISLNGSTPPQHVYQGRLNMLSVTGKKSFSEALKKRVDFDWDTIIEQACFKTIQAYRQGEPVSQIGNLPERNKVRYILYPYVMADSMTTIYGYGGSCKSYIAAFLAVMIQSGVGKIGFNPIMGNVLILDWEACREDWDERIKAIKLGMGIDSDSLPFYKRCYRTLAADILEIQKVILENKIKVVIIDSVGMASDVGDSFHSSAIQMLRAARSLSCSILLIDHKSKQNEMFGSVYKQNEVRSAFEIINNQEEGDDKVYLSIEHTKMNNGPKTKRVGLEIEFVGNEDITDLATFKRVDLADIPELSKNLPLKSRIEGELKRGALSVVSLAEVLEQKEDSIRVILNRHKDMFIKLSDGNWGLVSKGGLR
jgi:hypothetical protein